MRTARSSTAEAGEPGREACVSGRTARLAAAAGAAGHPETRLPAAVSQDPSGAVALLAQKEFLVTWDLNYMKYSGSQLIDWGSQISGRKVSLEGQPVGRGVDVVGGKAVQVHPAVAANAEARRFVVVWDNDRQISARLFDASGRKIGPVILVSTENDLQESFPHVAINAKGS